MRWDIKLTFFGLKDGGDGYFPRVIVERAFEGLTDRTVDDTWRVHGSDAIILLLARPEIRSFSVHEPPGMDHPFWPAITEVLRQTISVLAWPGPGCAAANPAVLAHIPADWDQIIGLPIITSDPARIYRIWQEALLRRAAEDAAIASDHAAWLDDYLGRQGRRS